MSSYAINVRTLVIIVLVGVFISGCTATRTQPSGRSSTDTPRQDVLYIYPDGKMEFRGRYMNEDEVVIYEDGFGGERAAVLIRVPYKEDIYRDTITVERKGVPIERVEEE